MKCIGHWCVTNEIPNELNQLLAMFPSLVLELLGYVDATVTSNKSCPMCRVVGPFRRDRATDAAQQVSNYNTPTVNHNSILYLRHNAQTPLIRFVVDLLYNFSICCGFVVDLLYNFSICCGLVDFMGLGVT